MSNNNSKNNSKNNNKGKKAGRGGGQQQRNNNNKQGNTNHKSGGGGGGRGRNNNNKGGRGNNNNNNKYLPHWTLEQCLELYVAKAPTLIRGRLRVLPAKDGAGFVACDRGSLSKDVMLESQLERNRGLNGDTVFVELLPFSEEEVQANETLMAALQINEDETLEEKEETWQDDDVQVKLWNPAVKIKRIKTLQKAKDTTTIANLTQRRGRVVHVCAPTINKEAPLSGTKNAQPKRIMVGTLRQLQSGTCLFTPNDKTLPQFRCSNTVAQDFRKQNHQNNSQDDTGVSSDLYKAEYLYHSWGETHNWPPCVNVTRLGEAYSIEDQIQGILMENNVDHGEFTPEVLQDVEQAVESGVYLMKEDDNPQQSLGWKPTPDMYKGRRDYRNQRIFTIDPTTAKDLDDALHITKLPDGTIELGVHIADVSHFVKPKSHVDVEALRRATTVYLVDRTVPMLPRPLCEVACSLNENVERLAFSCVWKMNQDGSLGDTKDIWYGRTVIKSCARLDYGTAQNIIDKKVAYGEDELDEELWPKSRRPTGGHTIAQVAADVRLMHKVAMARRRLRFQNGALALHGVKLTFKLDQDGETPLQCAPYPIKDSNRLVEEYMLLANYLVAQRLITHAGKRAVLRHHPDPLTDGLDKVVDVCKTLFGFDVDASRSESLHASLVQLGHVCNDETFLKCLTQLMTTPMQNADYFAAGALERELWRHFALNIPYYTHFTSPIRRYADVLVHRLLQATIDGEQAVSKFPLDDRKLQEQCEHCNEKRLASKMAQERCDVVFLALFLRKNPMKGELGVVMSLGATAFTVFVPSLGVNAMVFLKEHEDWLDAASQGEDHDRRLVLTRKPGGASKKDCPLVGNWQTLNVKVFSKVLVSCLYKDKPRVDVKLLLEGPAPV